jgi:hypothetical protein
MKDSQADEKKNDQESYALRKLKSIVQSTERKLRVAMGIWIISLLTVLIIIVYILTC